MKWPREWGHSTFCARVRKRHSATQPSAARCSASVSRAASAVNAGNYADQVRGMASQLLLEHALDAARVDDQAMLLKNTRALRGGWRIDAGVVESRAFNSATCARNLILLLHKSYCCCISNAWSIDHLA